MDKTCLCGEQLIDIECDNEDSGFRCEYCGLTIIAGTHSDAVEVVYRMNAYRETKEKKQ